MNCVFVREVQKIWDNVDETITKCFGAQQEKNVFLDIFLLNWMRDQLKKSM